MDNIIKINDDKSVHTPVSNAYRVLMDSFLPAESTDDVDNTQSPSMRSRF